MAETRRTEGEARAETGAAGRLFHLLQLLPRGPAPRVQTPPAAGLPRMMCPSRILPTSSRIWEVRSALRLPQARPRLPILEAPVKGEQARGLQRMALQRIFSTGITAMLTSLLIRRQLPSGKAPPPGRMTKTLVERVCFLPVRLSPSRLLVLRKHLKPSPPERARPSFPRTA